MYGGLNIGSRKGLIMANKKYPNKLFHVRDGLNTQLYNKGRPPLTQEALADKCGVTRQTIAAIENEQQMPLYPLAVRLYIILSKYKASVGYTLNLKLQELFPIPPLERELIKSAETASPETIEHL